MVRLANDLGIADEDVYPADYFDLMGGVGFGGLVAILLGHLYMNVDDAVEAFLDIALTTFPGDNPNLDSESRTKQLRESVDNVLQTRGSAPPEDARDKRGTRRIVLYAATTANINHPVAFRTYKPRGSSFNPTIVEAICATMATPPYLSPIKCGPRGRQQVFIGGPHGANNLTRELLKEASAIFGKDKSVAQIVSLGSGCLHISPMERNSNNEVAGRWVHEIAVDCEAVAKELSARLCDMDEYRRFNVERGMENMLMNQWDDLGPVEIHTSAYVETAGISEILDASLHRLQGSAGTVTLGEINHPSSAKNVRDKLDQHKKDLDHVIRGVQDNEDFRILDRLNPINAPSYYEGRICMQETRRHILDQIVTWATTQSAANSPTNISAPKNIFWLYGSPGLGKTSVANSLCRQLHERGNLGGSFFCRRDDPVLCDPNRLLPTLLYRLASMWSPYRDLVVQTLRGDPNLNPDWAGCALLLERLYSLRNHPDTPLVLVIDALDESGDPQTRAPLLRCFSDICARVTWIEFVVTSRPEHDISSFFQKLGLVGHDLSKDSQAHQDIRIFTKYRMALIAEKYCLPSDWPGESRLEQIARYTGGLFIFIETLYQFLDEPDPEPLLTQVLDGTLGDANAVLHKLYSTAIETRIGRNKKHFRLFIQAVIVVARHRPLPDSTLASLIGLEPRLVSSWVNGLGSILYRDVSENGGIRARHLSVIEFLTGPTCAPEFRVDIREADELLGHGCMIVMTKELKFNICKLENSCASNADIQDLDSRVQEKISDALQYSSMYWASHLCSGSLLANGVLDFLNAFLMGKRLLYWLEVLSLMGKVPVAILALRQMKCTLKAFEFRLQTLAEDALRFVLAFFTPIQASAPHIYISGLAFMPVECSLWKHASLSFPGLIDVCKGRLKSWPEPSGVWYGHINGICGVAYSPDGLNVISGSWDSTIRIWDVETGALVGEPLRGHTGIVCSVAYSPDGRSVVSGSWDNTIRIWDVETGAAVGEPLKGHTHFVLSVAYSPDGRNIVSGSSDDTIRIWDAQLGTPIRDPLRGHTDSVYSVAYSPDGRKIASGSYDGTIHIWDGQTNVGGNDHSTTPESSKLSNDYLSLISGLPIPEEMLDSNGWVHGTEGILFWVPEDCRHGLTYPATTTIPNTCRQRSVRVDFSRFQYGTSWTKLRGSHVEGQL